ncbi:helix-turn-helix transcriptional regulator [Streptomyces coelicoflavus]|uniref:helix-turn-helix transcriptional regulator n=1 Tax=Streptomyces coelicoflavus TaxID=285562 RepID=UPI00363F5CC1
MPTTAGVSAWADVDAYDLARSEADGLEDADPAQTGADRATDHTADDDHRHHDAERAESQHERDGRRGTLISGALGAQPGLGTQQCPGAHGVGELLPVGEDLLLRARGVEAVEHLSRDRVPLRRQALDLRGGRPGVGRLAGRHSEADDREGRGALGVRSLQGGADLDGGPLERRVEHDLAPYRDPSGLTPRELEVLRLLATGLSNAELASRLFLGPTTVKSHVGRIPSKLDLRGRVQAVVFAYETGLIAPGGGT